MSSLKITLGMLGLLTAVCGVAADAAEFEWVPLEADGSYSIDGNTITLYGDQQVVTLELYMSGWDPNQDEDPFLRTYQVTVDSDDYSSGDGEPLGPLDGCCPGDPDSCFVNEEHEDFVFDGIGTPVTAVCIVNLDYEMGGTVMGANGKADDGGAYYGATLVLEVPDGAKGTYTIGFVDLATKTFMDDEVGAPITPIDLTSAVIEVLCGEDSDCDDDNSCTSDTCNGDGSCSNDPLPEGRPCSDAPGPGTCDGQGNCVPLEKKKSRP